MPSPKDLPLLFLLMLLVFPASWLMVASGELGLAKDRSVIEVKVRTAHIAQDSAPRSDVRVLVGIYTRPDLPIQANAAGTDHVHAQRREAIRNTFMAVMRRHRDVVSKFVVGEPAFPKVGRGKAWQMLLQESGELGDFMHLPVPEMETYRSQKTKAFLLEALRLYPNVQYVIKAEDGTFLQPQRLLMAMQQWTAMHADYIGCMSFGAVVSDRRRRDHDPISHLLSAEYPMHADGAVYALSRRALQSIASNADHLRMLSGAEDANVGLWVLRVNTRFLNDQRLCDTRCLNNTIGIVSRAAGRGLSGAQLLAAARHSRCRRELPALPQLSAAT